MRKLMMSLIVMLFAPTPCITGASESAELLATEIAATKHCPADVVVSGKHRDGHLPPKRDAMVAPETDDEGNVFPAGSGVTGNAVTPRL